MRVLYLEGDAEAAKYVSGTLARMGVAHEVVRPGGPLPRDLSSFHATILSGFPRSALRDLEELIPRSVRDGNRGLLVIGGSRSLGRGGVGSSALGRLLPVELYDGDDRVQVPAGLLVEPLVPHTVLRGLDWSCPVTVVGRNRVRPRPQSTTVLAGRAIEATAEGLRLGDSQVPLLVLRPADQEGGRVAVLATDLAPPWCGGLLGWGRRLLDLGDGVEVGEAYATFVMNLVRWVAGEEVLRRPLPSFEDLGDLSALDRQPTLRARRKS